MSFYPGVDLGIIKASIPLSPNIRSYSILAWTVGSFTGGTAPVGEAYRVWVRVVTPNAKVTDVSVAAKKGPKWRATFRRLEDSVPAWVSGVKAKPSAHLRAALTPLPGRKCLALMGDIGPPEWPPF